MSAFTCPRCGRTTHHPCDVTEGYCGHCHDWTGKDGRWVTFRLWLGEGEARYLADETRLTPGPAMAEDLGAVGERHAQLVDAASPLPYLVEVEFWDGQQVRWGTTAQGMVAPEAVGSTDEALARLHGLVDQWG